MFFIAAMTLALIFVGVLAFLYGTVQLAKFAFRISTGRGIATLVFPPYTAFFAFWELEEEEKAIPTASWLFGIVVTALLLALFWTPISLVMTGQMDQLDAKTPGQVANEKFGRAEEESADEESADDESSDEASSDEEEASDDDKKEDEEKAEESGDGDKKGEKEGESEDG